MRLEAHDRRSAELRSYRADDIALDQAISVWRTWAAGHPITVAGLDHAAGELARYIDTVPEAGGLLSALALEHRALCRPERLDRAGVDVGLEL